MNFTSQMIKYITIFLDNHFLSLTDRNQYMSLADRNIAIHEA